MDELIQALQEKTGWTVTAVDSQANTVTVDRGTGQPHTMPFWVAAAIIEDAIKGQRVNRFKTGLETALLEDVVAFESETGLSVSSVALSQANGVTTAVTVAVALR